MNENFDPKRFINYNRGRTVFARHLRRHQTKAEEYLRQRLRKDQLGYRFLRQKPLGPYIANFYCAAARLCIEIDGDVHVHQIEYDQNRTIYLNDHQEG